ncbi:MAG TPA: archaetidylserine decarboxylase [Verrucomicrobiae bacterium]|nr:archaetidylserine decarboxylase [Verrucomicrobiae bacterium]
MRILLDRGYVALHSLLPTHFLSWLMFHICRIRAPGFKNPFITIFCKLYKVDLSDSEFELPKSYPDFSAFFTRALKPNARPLDPNPLALISPVDGAISQFGPIRNGTMIQAKGFDYGVSELLGGSKAAPFFQKGSFCTIYLAPHNYHRIHMPANGKLREWGYEPGRLFSVSVGAVSRIPKLFARNERVYAIFETDYGPLGIVMVGALFVGSMETVWNGRVTPPHGHEAGAYTPMSPVVLMRGRELGRFNMGSTVILLAPSGMVNWARHLAPHVPVRMGQGIGTLTKIR